LVLLFFQANALYSSFIHIHFDGKDRSFGVDCAQVHFPGEKLPFAPQPTSRPTLLPASEAQHAASPSEGLDHLAEEFDHPFQKFLQKAFSSDHRSRNLPANFHCAPFSRRTCPSTNAALGHLLFHVNIHHFFPSFPTNGPFLFSLPPPLQASKAALYILSKHILDKDYTPSILTPTPCEAFTSWLPSRAPLPFGACPAAAKSVLPGWTLW